MASYLVVGASSGIGLELAIRLLKDGDSLFLTYRSPSSLEKAKARLDELGIDPSIYRFLTLDLGDEASIDELSKSLEKESLDGIAFNAATYFPNGNARHDFPDEVFMVNAVGTYRLYEKLAANHPSVIFTFVTSIAAKYPRGGFASLMGKKVSDKDSYAYSKEAVKGIFALALREGRKAYLTHPGLSKTEIYRGSAPILRKIVVSLTAKTVGNSPFEASEYIYRSFKGNEPVGSYLGPKGKYSGECVSHLYNLDEYERKGEDFLALIEKLD